jgi:VanZ family protein
VVSVFLLTILPINTTSQINNITVLHFRGDYLVHALIFIPWMFFYSAMKINKWIWLLYGFLFAAASEAIQAPLPYRVFNINDMAANLIGITIGTLIFMLTFKLIFKD